MIFGDKNRFSIEYNLNDDYGGGWMFGKVCMWIKNRQIGDYELGVSLRDFLILILSIVRDNGNRESDHLSELSSEEIYTKLNDTFYGESINTERIAVEEMWARFNVNVPIDIFNDWKMFLVENQKSARLIFKNIRNNFDEGVQQIELEKGEFDQVINMVYEDLGRIYDLEKDNNI